MHATIRKTLSVGSASLLRVAVLGVLLLGEAAFAADYELVSTVIVSRHGVRSPTNSHPPLTSIAADPWPQWPVPAAYLTPRGAELARLLGVYYREYYAAQGLLPAQGCPSSGMVFAWADVDQRTRVTAQSLLDGMFPGCNFEPGYRTGAKVDGLFHPTRAGVCRIDTARARQSVNASANGLASLHTTFRAEIAAMQSVLKCCGPAFCRANGVGPSCGLEQLPTTIVGAHDRLRLSGPIAIGSTAGEVFLLEFAQGFPDDQVAWGRASTSQAIRPLLRLHTLQLALMQRTQYLAVRQGSALVDAVLSALRRSVEASTPAPPKLTLLVGHDTNLSNIGGMLGLHWNLPSYLPDQTPPAGALHFELLRDRQAGGYAVRITYIAQTLDQMRQVALLNLANPPEQTTVSIDGCTAGEGGVCPWKEFAALASRAIDRACVNPANAVPGR